MADSSRDIELRLRARDLSTAEVRSVVVSVNQLSAALDSQLQAATRLEIKEKELRSTLEQYNQAARNIQGIDAQIQRLKALSEQYQKNQQEVAKSQAALQAHQAAMQAGSTTGGRAETQLTGFERALASAEKRLEANKKAFDDLGGSLRQAGVDTENLVAIERELITTATEIGNARTKLNESIQNYSRYEREAKEAAQARAQAERDAAQATKAEAEALQAVAAAQLAASNALRKDLHDRIQANRDRVAQEVSFNEETKRLAKQRQDAATREATDTARATVKAQEERFSKLNAGTAEFNAQTRRDAMKRRDEETANARNLARQAINETFYNNLTPVQRANMERQRGQDEERSRGNQGGRGRVTREQQRNSIGLLPYESQNLLYQVTDVAQGFAIGQNPLQIFTQQGFQILQLWTKGFGDLLRILPIAAPAIAAVAVAIAAVSAAFRDQQALRGYSGLLKSISDGAGYSAPALVDLQRQVKALGLSWDESGKLIRQAIDNGLKQDRIKDFAQAARDIADIRPGTEVTKAFSDLVEGFADGITGIRKLNDTYHLFQPEQLQRITQLYNEKRGQEALNLAIDLAFKKLREGGKESVSPTTQAVRDLTKAWDGFLETLSKTGAIQNLVTFLTSVVTSLQNVINNVSAGVELLDAIDKKYPWLKYAVGGPLALGRIANEAISANVNAISGLIGGGTSQAAPGAPSVVDRKDGSTEVTIPSQANTVVDTILRHEGEKLRAMCAALVNEALKAAGLPTSGNNLASSFKNYGAAVAPESVRKGDIFYTDKGTEGFTGHVGVAMGPVVNGKVQVVSSHVSGPASNPAGTEFRDASNLVFRRPAYAGDTQSSPYSATGPQRADAQKGLSDLERERAIRNDINAGEARRNFELQQQEEILKKFPGYEKDELGNLNEIGKARQRALQASLADYDAQHYKERRDFDQQIRDARVTDGKNAEAIYQAGVKSLAIEKERYRVAGQILTQSEANAIQIKGMDEERKKFAQNEKQDNAEKSIQNALAALNRQNQLKDTESLENRLKGVANGYEGIRSQAKKQAEETANATTGGRASDFLAKVNPQIDTAERQAKALETAKFYAERLNSLQQQRTELINAQNAAYDSGGITAQEREDNIRKAFEATTPAITATTEEFKKFLDTTKELDPTKIDLYNAKIKEFKANASYISPLMKSIKDAVENAFTNGLSNAFNTVAESVGNLIAKTGTFKDVLTSLKTAAANFFASLLKDIATAILKYEALKLASSLGIGGGGGEGGIGGLLGSLFGGSANAAGAAGGFGLDISGGAGIETIATVVPILHGGGVPSRANSFRSVSSDYFAGAPRYHSGTSRVGLGPNEQAAILLKDEEVLNPSNPRHIMNAGGARRQPIQIRSVLVDDRSRVPDAMASAHGEEVIVNTLVRNASTLKAIVNG